MEGWIVGGGDTCAGLASEGETGESPPREPGCMWRVWPSVAVSTRAANGLREISQCPQKSPTKAFFFFRVPTTFFTI